ncbi:HAD-IIA family hydrolase [Aestuariimicrobium ganziense]|uniref:HAD-IIA family hydrolase n=1 Tax=Aestuariimicrobium ganziense TaxID=2773677 RepID=UPI0019447EE4|nr:HAD-IIA family hydrolase [Aestuariimicrobium ganziense]
MSKPLVDGYDAALFDLDGVVYLGPVVVEGAGDGIAALRALGVHIGFVTNNAARSPQHVADHLNELGVAAQVADVVTSAQACARLMASELEPGAKVLVVGTEAFAAEIAAVGLVPVSSHRDQPTAVAQGYHPALPWSLVDEACFAIQRGARWYVSNTDSTRPTDLGLVPGAGSQIQAVRNVVGVDPVVAGKPYTPLMHETVRRLAAERPIFVGDRIDTDIMGAVAVGMDSLFVFTGAHGKHDLVAADHTGRPTHLGWDLRALLAPERQLVVHGTGTTCGDATVRLAAGEVVLDEVPTDREGQLDALWALLHVVWTHGARADRALEELALLH